MKYNPPFGSTDPNAAYVDRNTPGAVSGSRVPAAALEHPQREIAAVIAAAGIEASSEDLTQLLQAIQNMIDGATGGAGDDNYVLMTQARVRLPIFPEVATADGKLQVGAPATGTVRIMPGYSFLHRGIFNVTTVQMDFTTIANKVYHLRWNPTTGYALKDLADVAYNAGGAAEDSAAFDTTYDDMLVARIVANASNVATITPLSNKNVLAKTERINKSSNPMDLSSTLDWARTPTNYNISIIGVNGSNSPDWCVINPPGVNTGTAAGASLQVNRYGMAQRAIIEGSSNATFQFNARA